MNPGNEKIGLAYARNLKRLGVEAKVRTVDTAQYQYRRNVYDFDGAAVAPMLMATL